MNLNSFLLIKALLFVALFSFTASAQPIIKFEKPKQKYGKVRKGEVIDFYFTYFNKGNQPLIISAVNITCDCTTPIWPKQPLLPSKSDTIKVNVKTEKMYGWQDRTLEVISNAKNSPHKIRYIVDVDDKNPLD